MDTSHVNRFGSIGPWNVSSGCGHIGRYLGNHKGLNAKLLDQVIMDINKLKTELAGEHPVTGIYDADNKAAADQWNEPNIDRDRTHMSGSELMEIAAGHDLPTSDEGKRLALALFALGRVPYAIATKTISAAYGEASDMVAEVKAARVEKISLATFHKIGKVKPGNIQEARMPGRKQIGGVLADNIVEQAIAEGKNVTATITFDEPPAEDVTFYVVPWGAERDERQWIPVGTLLAGEVEHVLLLTPVPIPQVEGRTRHERINLAWRPKNHPKIEFSVEA